VTLTRALICLFDARIPTAKEVCFASEKVVNLSSPHQQQFREPSFGFASQEEGQQG
jgi:hypothetical protein